MHRVNATQCFSLGTSTAEDLNDIALILIAQKLWFSTYIEENLAGAAKPVTLIVHQSKVVWVRVPFHILK